MSTDTIDPGTLAERAARGAAECDRVFGKKWTGLISIKALDMGNCSRCILGQIQGGYFAGLRAIGAPSDEIHGLFTSRTAFWARHHGFSLPGESTNEEWDALADTWRAEIRARVDAETTS